MHVRVLGPIEADGSTGVRVPLAGAKMRGFLAVLALDPGSSVPAERLIDAVWGEGSVKSLNVVQVVVSKVRQALAQAGEADRIVTDPSGYRLDLEPEAVDALRFEAIIRDAASVADAAARAALLQQALGLWRGNALADGPATPVTDAIRSRLDELRRVAVENHVDAELELGRHHRLAPEIEALVAEEPLRERRWGQLMRALYGSGQQAEALRAFQRARDVLVDQMGVEPSPELRRLEAAVLAHDTDVLGTVPSAEAQRAPIGGGFRRRGNVRHPVGSCVGRKDEVERLLGLLERHRLVTLVGTGGVGKTRLAQEVAVQLAPEVPDGVWWVDLAAAGDANDVVAALQLALQLEPSGAAGVEEAVANVGTALGDGTAVIVLDNCEQLLGSIGTVIEGLLGQCGGIRVMATSRAALDLRGEVILSVLPLEQSAAMTLFAERIEGLDPAATHDDASIGQICEQLDRLPLALELAAARARHLSLDEILARLTDRFELLRDRSSGPASHQSDLRAVADWSYELLDDAERQVFERLSVFAAGATLAAARAVCAGGEIAADDVEGLLARLVDKSLVYSDRSGASTRYRMLQTLADYARERLAERGAEDEAHRAHAHWVHDIAAAVRFGARTTGASIAAVQAEDVAVRDAIAWALAADPPLALEICTDLGPFWFGTMRVSTGWELLEEALAVAEEADGERRGSALVWAVVFATMVHDLATAERATEEAWAFESEHPDPERLGRLCFARALAEGYRGDGDATPWLDGARRQFLEAGSELGLAHLDFADGALRLVTGDLDGAASGLGAAAEVFRREQDHLGLILAVSRLGELAWRVGDLDEFARRHEELLELGRASASPGVITGATARLALARLEQGDLDAAQVLAADALVSTGESFMAVINGYAFKSAGLVNLALGHRAEGREQLRVAVDAFGRGTGQLGTGLAALCWVDLSRSFADDDVAAARAAAETALELALIAGDPWVVQQAEGQRAAVPSGDLA
jgi:predicted ATPase/DNA-binding SARP family transcriptional activator